MNNVLFIFRYLHQHAFNTVTNIEQLNFSHKYNLQGHKYIYMIKNKTDRKQDSSTLTLKTKVIALCDEKDGLL